MRKRTMTPSACGSMWMSLARSAMAFWRIFSTVELAPPDRPAGRGHFPPAQSPAPATQQPPRPPNPKPDDDMPF